MRASIDCSFLLPVAQSAANNIILLKMGANLSKEKPTTQTKLSCIGSVQILCILTAGGVFAFVKITRDG